MAVALLKVEMRVAREEALVMLALVVVGILLQLLQAKVLVVVLAAHRVGVQLTPTVEEVAEAVARQVLLVQPDQMSQEVAMVAMEQHQVFLDHR